MQVNWKKELSQSKKVPKTIKTPVQLEAKPHLVGLIEKSFPTKIPNEFLSTIQHENCNDPVALQFLPSIEELHHEPGYTLDPLREAEHHPLKGLIHKYPSRILIILTGACAVHCRYCFRRHYNYSNFVPGKKELAAIFQYLNKNSMIKEVILSGGDPLTASDLHIEYVLNALSKIKHLELIRFHTRIPMVLGSRITDSFLSIFKKCRQKIVFVIHTNHAKEFNTANAEAIKKLYQAGITLFNQSVLLKGINDSADALINLSYTLFKHNIQPYYIHLLDPVKGAHHFEVSLNKARDIEQTIRESLPGYLMPRFVFEEPGTLSKQPFI